MTLRTKQKHLTQAKIDRAILAMVELIETVEFDRSALEKIDAACDAARAMQSRVTR